MNKILSFSSEVCVNPVPLNASVGGAGQPSAEGEEWPAVPDGGGSGGHERADEETQSCGCPGNNLPDASVGSSKNLREHYFQNPFVIKTQTYSCRIHRWKEMKLTMTEIENLRDSFWLFVLIQWYLVVGCHFLTLRFCCFSAYSSLVALRFGGHVPL